MKKLTPDEIAKPLFSGRRMMWIGCAFIMAVMCASTADAIYSLRRAAIRSDAVVSAFRDRSRLLDELRNLMVRSARSPNIDGQIAMDASELPAAHLQADEILQAFETSLEASGDQATQQKFADLKTSIDRYWAALPNFRQQSEKDQNIRALPAGVPERRHIARQIMELNRQQQDRAEAQLQRGQRSLQTQLLLSSSGSLIFVFILMAGMSYRVTQAETYADARYLDVVQTRTELRNLAGRLETAQEEERRKLSRELHDEFGQTMAAALVELSRVPNEMLDGERAKGRLAGVKAELENSLRSIRDIALLLRPSMLDDLGLVPALRWQGRETARRSGLAVRVEADDKPDFLPDAHRTCIYRVAQEALHNVVKHASATSVLVEFRSTDASLALTIQDNGQGFIPGKEKGLGLLGIEERVGRLAGQVQIRSQPDRGTFLHVTLPMPSKDERGLV